MKYLNHIKGEEFTDLTTKGFKTLIGKRIAYIRKQDIDKSGRGYYFPRFGTVNAVQNRKVEIDGDGFCTSIKSFVEVVIL